MSQSHGDTDSLLLRLALGVNPRYFAEADGLSLGPGPFVKALEYASGVEALVAGYAHCRELNGNGNGNEQG